jgi:hypothetical protein
MRASLVHLIRRALLPLPYNKEELDEEKGNVRLLHGVMWVVGCDIRGEMLAWAEEQVRFCRDRLFPFRRLGTQGDQGRGRVRIQVHCTSIGTT